MRAMRRGIGWLGWMVLALACGDDSAVPDAGTDAAMDASADAFDGGTDARVYVPEPFEPTDATRAYCNGDVDAIEQRITELLATLSIAQKQSLMHGASLGLIDDVWRVNGIEELGIPGLRMLDGPRGLSRFSGKAGTAFPVAMLRGATWQPSLEQRVGAAMAREHWSAGADVILAPTINILRHPRWGRAQETYSEDSHHMAELGIAFVRGAQSEGVLASAKHFAANSIEDTRHTVNVEVGERTLREIYLPHFRRVVQEAQVASVMSAYNQVNGFYCDLNQHLLTDILKGEWEFQGFVESDWIAGTHADTESVLAGLDLEMPFNTHFRRLEQRVRAGELDEQALDRSVRRLLRAQLCFDLEREHVEDPGARETAEHLELAREVAQRGIVLLRNEGALPLAGDLEIVVLGRVADVENIGDTGSSSVSPAGDIVTALEGLQARFANVMHVPHVDGMTTLSSAEQATVSGADAVIFVTGLVAEDEGEATVGAGDRDSLDLPTSEAALLTEVAALSDRVIVVVEAGAAITMPWSDEVEAILFAFYPGQHGGHALADLLAGDANPQGRLPFSIPRSVADLPPFDNESADVTYGYFHGYRHLLQESTPAHYPFGFGLAYGDVTYSAMALSSATARADDTVIVELDVENLGTRDRVETVQLYVAPISSRVERAPRELKAFAQVDVPAGETFRASIELPVSRLAFWNTDTNAWEVESIGYELIAARHAEDVGVRATLSVE